MKERAFPSLFFPRNSRRGQEVGGSPWTDLEPKASGVLVPLLQGCHVWGPLGPGRSEGELTQLLSSPALPQGPPRIGGLITTPVGTQFLEQTGVMHLLNAGCSEMHGEP